MREEKEHAYLAEGYTYADTPFTLEYGLICAFAISLLLVIRRWRRKARRSLTAG